MSIALDIDKSHIKKSFSSAAETYDGQAYLQRKVGFDLIEKYNLTDIDIYQKVDSVLDIGCGTGFLTEYLLTPGLSNHVYALDIALSMLHVTQTKLSSVDSVSYVCADAERLPLRPGSIHRIYSNLALQWSQNIVSVLQGFNEVLVDRGLLFFSTFGEKTLWELKSAWAEIDDYSHVNEFYNVAELEDFLQRAGFKNIELESRIYPVSYPSVLSLMKELKGIGAHNMLPGRNKNITSKSAMLSMIKAYEEHKKNNVIPATYEIIFAKATVV